MPDGKIRAMLVNIDPNAQPYAVPVVDTAGNPRVLVVLASAHEMREMAAMGAMVLHAHQSRELSTVKEHAELVKAVFQRDSHLHFGGKLQ